jgi:hypothetical protein
VAIATLTPPRSWIRSAIVNELYLLVAVLVVEEMQLIKSSAGNLPMRLFVKIAERSLCPVFIGTGPCKPSAAIFSK